MVSGMDIGRSCHLSVACPVCGQGSVKEVGAWRALKSCQRRMGGRFCLLGFLVSAAEMTTWLSETMWARTLQGHGDGMDFCVVSVLCVGECSVTLMGGLDWIKAALAAILDLAAIHEDDDLWGWRGVEGGIN